MNQKELNELRRRWKQDKNTISRVYGCFVNGNKEIITDLDESLGMMTQEEAEKYLSLLKKALSGALGKNLIYCVFHPAGHDGRRTQNVDGAAHIRREGCADAAGILSESHSIVGHGREQLSVAAGKRQLRCTPSKSRRPAR